MSVYGADHCSKPECEADERDERRGDERDEIGRMVEVFVEGYLKLAF